MTPEFSRIVRVDTIGDAPRTISIEADAEERAALARRFGLIAIDRLAADFTVRREGEGVALEGQVRAAATQSCSVTGVPLPATVDEAARLRFAEEQPEGEDIELDDSEIDVLPIEDGAIDLGEAAAETLALSLDPFPRSPQAAEALAAAGVLDESAVGPFSALAALKGKLGK